MNDFNDLLDDRPATSEPIHVTMDFETRSECDLMKSGASIYSLHPSTKVLCLYYQINDEPRQCWLPGDELPRILFNIILYHESAEIEAHGSQFEYWIWQNVCVARMGWPAVPDHKWRCTMAAAAYRGLPMKLEKVGDALGLDEGQIKDKGGTALINQLCKPRTPAAMKRAQKLGDFSIWDEDPEKYKKLYKYCDQDIVAEKSVITTTGPLPAAELDVWRMCQEINRRGVKIDTPFVEAAQRLVDRSIAAGEERLREITGGAVKTINQTAKICEWLRETQGINITSLAAEAVDFWLDEKVTKIPAPTPVVIEVLRLRKSLARSSVKKLVSMMAWAALDPESRARGMFQYYGAMSTGRWAGRGPQPQNFPRPRLTDRNGKSLSAEFMYDLIMSEDIALIEMCGYDPLDLIADALRSAFVAEAGKQYNSVDFSAIEAIVTAGICGEERKLQLFRDGLDPYCVFAETIFGHPVNKKDHPEKRQVGKIGELSFGYRGGVRAWRNFDDTGRPDKEIEGYRDVWRGMHPNICGGWDGLEDCAKDAIKNPGECYSYGDVSYQIVYVSGYTWLACRLPSGRCIWYFDPKMLPHETPWGEVKSTVSYMAWKEGQWRRTFSHGGKFLENVVQAASRDILVNAMFRFREEGWPVVMHSHDELVAEVPEGTPLGPMVAVFAEKKPWNANWPLKGEGWIGPKYRK